MQPYYVITKFDTEFIRFGKSEVEKFTQSTANGFDSYSAAKRALNDELANKSSDYELKVVDRTDSESVTRMILSQPEFHEDYFGNKSRCVKEMFIVKAVV